jgi:hypothetical protein
VLLKLKKILMPADERQPAGLVGSS